MDPDDVALLGRIRLARTPGIGPRAARLLEERAGPPAAIFALSRAELVARGVPLRLACTLTHPATAETARRELARLRELGCGILPLGSPDYPESLSAIHDPPQLLTFRGTLGADDERAVSIVGARRATPEGRHIAFELAGELAAAGVTVVSGLARGIDTSAHEGALAAGGRTLAVLASGLSRVYPVRNTGLARRIVRSGALLSEFPPDAEPRRHSFPQRNRIVTGLSLGVVVVQAGPRSGALISADFALQQGRELFAVPGSIREPLAQGTYGLIKDGARLVERAADVLDVLFGVQHRLGDEGPSEDRSPEQGILRALASGRCLEPVHLSTTVGLEPDVVMTALGRLELAGKVMRTPNGYRRSQAP